MPLVEGEAALAAFRAGLTGRYGLDLLREHGGKVLVQWPVGVGKSVFLDAVTEEAVKGGHYDLVVVLAPTRRLIAERRPRRRPPQGARVVTLRPRPAHHCGPGRDEEWSRFEAADLGALGRLTICGGCPLERTCFWPRQYGKGLHGTRILYATQAHLERSPEFLSRLQSWAGAARVLTLVDETDFSGKSFEEQISAADLDRFVDALRNASGHCTEPWWQHDRWLRQAELLRSACLDDLQVPVWRMPSVHTEWAAHVQRAGLELHGDAFRFLGYRLAEFGYSPPETRRKDESGAVQFSTRPFVGDCLVFSGTTDAAFLRHRLGKDVASPFAGLRFAHPGTRWFNIASPIGARSYFPSHAQQVLDFFAELTIRRAGAGKRVLWVAKKCFARACAAEMRERFKARGVDLKVVTGGWSERRLADRRVVPVITYGTVGTNLFEHFDCAFCLTSYYVDEGVLNQCLQDLTRPDLRLPVVIRTAGDPRRRLAGVADPAHGDYDVARLAQPALEYKEHGVVVQAVGRVRPFTRPREVVTFQMAELPGVTYDAEFRTLAEARRHFGIPSGRQRTTEARAVAVSDLRSRGLSQAEVARRLGVSERTVRIYEKKEAGKKPSLST
jgi:hypothetical protein